MAKKKEKKNEEKSKTGATELFIAFYICICTRDLSSPHYQSTFKAFTYFSSFFYRNKNYFTLDLLCASSK